MSDQPTKFAGILTIVGGLFIIWGIIGFLDSKNYAYSGYSTDGNNTITQVREGSPAESAGMQVGDVMKSYDGIAVSDSKSFAQRKRTEIGQVVDIVVDRGGEEQTLQVTYSALPGNRSTLNTAGFLMGLLFILLGLFVHYKKKNELSFAFALFGVLFGYIWLNGPNIEPGFLNDLMNSINITIIMLAFVALAQFTLKYPPKSSLFNGGESKWLYAPAVVLIVILWILNFVHPDRTSTLNTTINMLFFVVILFYFGFSLYVLVRKYMKSSAADRAASGMNLMLWGAVLGLLPFLIMFTIDQFSPMTVVPGSDYMFLTFAFIPIFFSMALLKQRN